MKPLDGVRVLDLTHVLAGPFCTYQLAVLGADVVKIESPHRPDMTREEGVLPAENQAQYGTYFQAQNAGKRAMTLDLKTDGGRSVMTNLVRGADVLVQNYGGNALAELGFGYPDTLQINPRLVYCSLSGFGQSGDKAAHRAYDVVIQAFSGLMDGNGEAGSPPTRVGPPMVDYGTGAQAAFAVVAALYQRNQTGLGQHVDVSMLDSALMMMSSMVVDTLITGEPPPAHGNAHSSYAGYSTFDTADGLLMIGAWTNEQMARLLDLLGEHGHAQVVRETPRNQIGRCRDELSDCIAAHMKARSAAEWEAVLNTARIPASRVRGLSETLAEEQVRTRGGLQSVTMPTDRSGPPLFPVAGFSYAHDGPEIERPPPQLGEHTDEVLVELGYDRATITGLRQQGAV